MFGKEKQQADLELFTIFDSKSKSYESPAFEVNKDVLMRGIINMFNDPKNAQNRYLVNAEDFSIFKIASYSKRTGLIESQNLEHIANMHDLRALSNWTPRQFTGPEILNNDTRDIVTT